MKPEWKRFATTAPFIVLTGAAFTIAAAQGKWNLVLVVLFACGAVGVVITQLLWVTRMFDFRGMERIEAQFAQCRVLTLKRSHPLTFAVGMVTLFSMMVALFWHRFLAEGAIAKPTDLAWGIGGLIFLLLALGCLILFLLRNRLELQRYESERAAITSSGVSFMHRSIVKEATSENTKLVRIYAVQPIMVSVETTQGHFGFNSRVEGFEELAKAVLALTDKVKIYGRKDRLPPQMHEWLRGKKVL